MLLVIQKLREIADYIAADIAVPEELALWLEHSLREFLEHRSTSVDEALGLRFPKGGVPWWIEEGMRRRDSALQALADQPSRRAELGRTIPRVKSIDRDAAEWLDRYHAVRTRPAGALAS